MDFDRKFQFIMLQILKVIFIAIDIKIILLGLWNNAVVWQQPLSTLWFHELGIFQEFISSTKRPYAKEMETVDFKDKLEETKDQINSSIKDLTDGKYLFLFCYKLLSKQTLPSHESFS